jgi:hypothetical protein
MSNGSHGCLSNRLELAPAKGRAAELERARLTSNTQKYTHVAMVDIVDAYNLVHPRA